MSIKFNFLKQNGFKQYLLSKFPKCDIESIFNFYVENNSKIINTDTDPVLIKGEVQSGKTNNIIYLIYAFSNTYDCFIYLSGKLNLLNEQNKLRIENAVKFFDNEYSSLNMRWKSISSEKLGPSMNKKKKLLFFGIKKIEYLEKVLYSIQHAKPGVKIVIFDDESDIYTLSDKSLNARRKKIVNNNNIKYISITGTPYINLFKYSHFYRHYFIYKSPPSYKGLKEFMNSRTIKAIENKDLVLFNLVLKLFKNKTGTIIWNVSKNIKDHEDERKYIVKLLENKFNGWLNNKKTKKFLEKNKKTKHDIELFIFKLRNHVYIDNSKTKAKKSEYRIIIGRETMARGITFKNLIGEYIEYNGNKLNPSVIMQAARWFGIRDLSRMLIYMSPMLKEAYKECLKLEKITDTYILGSANEYSKKVNDLKLNILEVD